MPLTVLAVADQISPLLYDHYQRARWESIDLVLSCGDLAPDYLDFLCTQLNVPVFYVRGNHDGKYRREQYDGSVDIHGRLMSYRGVRVAGFEGSRRYNGGSCQYSEEAMSRKVRSVGLRTLRYGRPDIVLTHAPPAGCHDGEDVCHRGFDCFTLAIDAWRPAYFIHGHTHAYYRTEKESRLGETCVVNAFPYFVFQVPLPHEAREKRREHRPLDAMGRSLFAVVKELRKPGTLQ